jgi:aldose 1-epimerase
LTDLVTLRAGSLEAVLSPAVGGRVARFDRVADGKREPLFLPAPDDAHVLGGGCFPLVPFANRIRGGTFVCDGRTVRLAPNMKGDKSPLHGQGWHGTWRVEAADNTHARLAWHHGADEWPWDYRASLDYRLDDDGLEVILACENRSRAPMPCGLGLHPYYPCDGDTRLNTGVAAAWTVDGHVLPVESVPAEGRYGLSDRTICGAGLDNGFDGWDGDARISWPARKLSLRLTSLDAGRFQVYSPPTGGLFVAEPVQNANAALNAPQAQWPDLGVRMLAQGERATLRARFDVRAG